VLHPLIVFGLVFAASTSPQMSFNYRTPADDTHNTKSSADVFIAVRGMDDVYAILMVPFAFNFGVEPFDLSGDVQFLICFYLHHFAVVLACCRFPWCYYAYYHDQDNHNNASFCVEEGDTINQFGLAQALLLAHAWALHPIG
jgi:hypothetical protein